MILKNKNILITGASRGLGKSIAEVCWKHGANVLLVARTGSLLESFAAQLAETPLHANQHAHALAVDLSADGAAAEILAHSKKIWPAIHGLVNNAGILGPVGKAWENDWAQWQQTVHVNLMAPVELCRVFSLWMIASGGGSVVNLSGGGATGPRPNFSAYAAAKTGLVRFTEILARELDGTKVRANSIAPGAMATDMLKEILDAGIDKVGADEFTKIEKQAKSGGVPPEKAAELCAFLLSDESAGISGKLLSAQWDPWEKLGAHAGELSKSDVYTLRRIVPEDRHLKLD